MAKNYPYTDDYMIFDEKKYRYILTAKYVLDSTGINLTTRLNAKGSANAQSAVNGFLDRISVLTYKYIDAHSINTQLRNHIIAICPSARPILQEAMLAQALYVLTNGDLSLSADKEKRALWFDETARITLCKLSEYGLTQKFDDYVYVKNYERKKRACRIKMERKIFRAKTDDRRKALEEERDKGLACIISVVMFGVLLGTIGFEPVNVGWNILIKTFIKLFQAAYAVYVGGSEGISFARGNLFSALGNRAKFVQLFIDANKPDSAAVDKLREEERCIKQSEAEKILLERHEEIGEEEAWE